MGIWQNLFKKKSFKNTEHTIPVSSDTKDMPDEICIECRICSGIYEIRSGEYGMFAGCSNYPDCKSTLSLAELVLAYIKKYGLNIYCWEKECYKCKNKTNVYSYYLNYDLENLDEDFSAFGPCVGLGDLHYADEILAGQIPTIQRRYSKTTHSYYMANTCQHCGALQGRNYVVEDPHEIIVELWHNHNMEKYLYKNIKFKDITPLKKDIETLYNLQE